MGKLAVQRVYGGNDHGRGTVIDVQAIVLERNRISRNRPYLLEHFPFPAHVSGYVTYPRTDCEYIPEGHFPEASGVIDAIRAGCPELSAMLGGVDLARKSPAWNSGKISEHHAIIPTTRVPIEGSLSDSGRKIYGLICARYALQFLSGT
jgi:DNA topoisomerase IA